MKWLDRVFGGSNEMAALAAGKKAPEFDLPTLEGKNFVLREVLRRGPVLAVFFKVSCPTCQYTFPFIERLHRAYGDQKITIVGVSQNDRRETEAFRKEYGVTFPIALDDPNGYAVSNAYGLTNVPTLFLIEPDGKIEITSVGWSKKEVEEINRNLAEAEKVSLPPLFRAGEEVRDFRAG